MVREAKIRAWTNTSHEGLNKKLMPQKKIIRRSADTGLCKNFTVLIKSGFSSDEGLIFAPEHIHEFI